MLRKEELLKDNVELKTDAHAFVFNGYHTYFAPVSGFIEYVHPLEKKIKEGELLYRIHVSDSLDKTSDIIAQTDCIIMKYQPTHIATVGDEVVMVVDLSEIKNTR